MLTKITAVIPVKKNSTRLPGKNILPFGDSTLLEHKIIQLKKCKGVSRIIVTSDSDQMLEMAYKLGVEAILRPADLADESRPLSDFFDYICTIIDDGHLMWACCTSPLFDESLMNEAVECYFKNINSGYDSLISVTKHKHYLMDKNGPINYSLGLSHCNSQELPDWYLFTNGILIAPIDSVKEWHYNYGPKSFYFEIEQSKSIDIDTQYDYLSACSWYKYLKSEII